MSVKCVSDEGVLQYIDRESFNNKVDNNLSLFKTIIEKLNLMHKAITSFAKFLKADICHKYYKTKLHGQLVHKLTKKQLVHYDTINNYEVINNIDSNGKYGKRDSQITDDPNHNFRKFSMTENDHKINGGTQEYNSYATLRNTLDKKDSSRKSLMQPHLHKIGTHVSSHSIPDISQEYSPLGVVELSSKEIDQLIIDKQKSPSLFKSKVTQLAENTKQCYIKSQKEKVETISDLESSLSSESLDAKNVNRVQISEESKSVSSSYDDESVSRSSYDDIDHIKELTEEHFDEESSRTNNNDATNVDHDYVINVNSQMSLKRLDSGPDLEISNKKEPEKFELDVVLEKSEKFDSQIETEKSDSFTGDSVSFQKISAMNQSEDEDKISINDKSQIIIPDVRPKTQNIQRHIRFIKGNKIEIEKVDKRAILKTSKSNRTRNKPKLFAYKTSMKASQNVLRSTVSHKQIINNAVLPSTVFTDTSLKDKAKLCNYQANRMIQDQFSHQLYQKSLIKTIEIKTDGLEYCHDHPIAVSNSSKNILIHQKNTKINKILSPTKLKTQCFNMPSPSRLKEPRFTNSKNRFMTPFNITSPRRVIQI